MSTTTEDHEKFLFKEPVVYQWAPGEFAAGLKVKDVNAEPEPVCYRHWHYESFECMGVMFCGNCGAQVSSGLVPYNMPKVGAERQ